MARNPSKRLRKGPTKPTDARSGGERAEIVHSSVYLPKPLHQRLREIAFKRDCKIHDLIIEGIEAVILRHGVDLERARKAR